MNRLKYHFDEVLKLGGEHRSPTTVREYYKRWRKEKSRAYCCDMVDCHFHTNPLEWRGRPLPPLILDHISGNREDNRPENLRLLCPACDSQNKETRGGANARKRTHFPDGSYYRKRANGTEDAVLKATSLGPTTTFGTPAASTTSPGSQSPSSDG
jgi:HNH endonuclease